MPGKKNQKKEDKNKGNNNQQFRTVDELWTHVETVTKGDLYDEENGWYGKSKVYWGEVPATVNGVLTGNTLAGVDMSRWHDADIEESKAFISSIPNLGRNRCVDCGAGMGRVTKDLLCPLFAQCDLVESQPHMLEGAREYLAGCSSANEFILDRLETCVFPPNTYDVIFMELAAMYLTDKDLISFLKRNKSALTKRGVFFLKENCAKVDQYDIDPEDNGLLRTSNQFLDIFAQAGLKVIREENQQKWPQDFATLKMFALR